MNIAFESQPIVSQSKTGVGSYQYWLTKMLLTYYQDNRYSFEFFSFRDSGEKKDRIKEFLDMGGLDESCAWFPGSLYRMMWNFVPVPYRVFFPGERDITHFFNYHIPPGVKGKKIAVVHDMTYRAFPETVRLKTRIMLEMSLKNSCRRADKIMTISEFSKNEIIKYMGIDRDKIFVAHCGVDTNVFKPVNDKGLMEAVFKKYGIRENYLLYLGTLEPRKNIERLIEAYSKVENALSNAPLLVIAGMKGWLYESIFSKVKSLRLETKVIFTGYIDDGDAPLLYNGAMGFVFPSLYEGFGMPPLEAMACGTPVITSHAASLPEVVGDAALLADPFDVDDIYRNIKKLIESSQLREEVSQKGMERSKKFTWKNTADIVMEEYKKLLV